MAHEGPGTAMPFPWHPEFKWKSPKIHNRVGAIVHFNLINMYSGTFSIANKTGNSISNVSVEHIQTDYPNATLSVDSLDNGSSSGTMAFDTNNHHGDYWYVSFLDSSGNLWTGNERCGFESEDNGHNVTITLNATQFSITMPASSSCTDNDYDQV